MKTKLIGTLILLLFVAITIIPSSTIADYRDEQPTYTTWTNTPPNVHVGWISDKTIGTNKDAIPVFEMFWANLGNKQIITFKTRILGYNSSWSTGWGIDTLMSTYPSDAFYTGSADTEGGKGTYGVHTDTFYKTAPKSPSEYSGYAWGIFIRVPSNAVQSSVSIECNITDGKGYTSTEYATLGIASNQTYSIVLASTKLEETINPDETISHPFTIVNLGTQDNIDVLLNYAITVKDEDGNSISNKGWSIVFYDYYNRKITIYQNIGRLSTVHPSFSLTAPSSEDGPPAGSVITITLTGYVVNNTKFSDTVGIGGDDFTTSKRFTGEATDQWSLSDLFGTTFWSSPIGIVFIIFIFLIIIVIGYLLIGARGTKKN